MNSTIEDRLRGVFADTFETEPESISEEMSTATSSSWDSLRAIVLATSVEAEFGIEFSDLELATLDSYRKILEAVRARNF